MVIFESDLFHETVETIHSFRGYLEQIIFERNLVLKIATFLEELS